MVTADEVKGRAERYRFLASIYLSPPTPEWIGALKDEGLVPDETNLEEVKQEFQNLFKVPLGQYTTPYEAVYRDEREIAGQRVRGLLMGPSTVTVCELYRRAGAGLDPEVVKELPDHVGVELAFMEYLCRQEAEIRARGDAQALKAVLESELKFLREHLSQWLPQLVSAIQNKGRLDFYKKLAALTEEVVEEELDYLQQELKT